MSIIYITGVLSLIIQIITGLFDYYVLKLDIPEELSLLKELLLTEFIVQIIEGTFYLWMILNFSKIRNITPHRYFDWVITTPTMLLTYCIFLIYLKNTSENTNEKTNTNENQKGMIELIKDNWKVLLPIILLNWMMLLFGYLGEMKVIPMITANILGFIPFVIYFWLIYENFAKDFALGRQTFIVFFGLWLLYGVAAFFPYYLKNSCFNILDLFAKNFFGIFIAAFIMYKLKKYKEKKQQIQQISQQ
jgi:hypothetical protein